MCSQPLFLCSHVISFFPPYCPILQYYFTKNRGKADNMTTKEKRLRTPILKPLFSYLFFKILNTNNWVFSQS